jgi:hypothetical protein
MNENQAIGTLVVTLIVLVVVFILTRVFWLWYWNISEGISLLKQMRDSLRVLELAQVATQTTANDRIRLARTMHLRQEPRDGARALTNVIGGTFVTVIKTDGAWAWVQTDDGREGWAPLPLDR